MTFSQTRQLTAIVRLRLLVAFLGEKKQHGWWDTSFLDATGRRFLETTFPRTAFEAAVRCASEGARLVHDAQIARVGTFHLFRLTVEAEDAIEAQIGKQLDRAWLASIADAETAARELVAMASSHVTASPGPVQIGTVKNALSAESASEIAAHYYSAFDRDVRCYPYFATTPNGRK
jgi:hypothetical protein